MAWSFLYSVNSSRGSTKCQNEPKHKPKITAYGQSVSNKEFRHLRQVEYPTKHQFRHLAIVCHARWNLEIISSGPNPTDSFSSIF